MTTTPSPKLHEFVGARDLGQGEQRFCRLCGAREVAAELLPPCLPQLEAPRGVRSDYDPLA
jgi:hypothetical protein